MARWKPSDGYKCPICETVHATQADRDKDWNECKKMLTFNSKRAADNDGDDD